MMGMKVYFTIQKVFVTWSIIGAIIAGIILTATTHEQFVVIWNEFAAQNNSLDFAATVNAASAAMEGIPETWNWKNTIALMLPVSWVAVYGYIITFIGGEVKSPRKNIFIAQILNAVICIAFLLWVGLMYQRVVGWEGIHALAWIGEEGLEGYNMPFEAIYINIASMLVRFNWILGFIMAAAFILADWLWVVFSYIAWSRAAFAWGMDRLGPKWFTDISPRFNQPVKLLLVMFVASQIVVTQYCLNPQYQQAISVEVLQLISVFGVTAISCLIFPYVKKVRHIWDASPYKSWSFLGIPAATIAGFFGLTLTVLLVVAYYVTEAFAFMYEFWTLVYVIVWAFGISWYFIWKAVRKKDGIDVTLAFKEIPPE
jgi:amino acid transporter